jgi:hypothetical protein
MSIASPGQTQRWQRSRTWINFLALQVHILFKVENIHTVACTERREMAHQRKNADPRRHFLELKNLRHHPGASFINSAREVFIKASKSQGIEEFLEVLEWPRW